MATKLKALPFVEENEVDEAKALIDKQFIEMCGKPFTYRPAGYSVVCKIYVSPDELMEVTDKNGKKVILYTAPMTKQQDELKSVTALVCAMGPQAYKGNHADGTERFPEGPWCRIGDWINLPRHSAYLMKFRGVALASIPDDKVQGVIDDPSDLTEFYVGNKI